jgi:hypothetical protein
MLLFTFRMKYGVYLCFTLQFILSGAVAQRQLTGIIKGNSEILVGVTIENISQDRINISDMGGNYRISAGVGDTVVFSHEGFITDTVVTNEYSFNERLPIELKIKITNLNSVEVNEFSKYTADSLERRQDYDYIFKKTNNKKLYNNKLEGDGHAVNFSPLGHFSSEEKQKRKLKERLEAEDKEQIIYLKYSRRVPKLTGLQGDSLYLFINKYKPSYEYCLRASNMDILVYINDKLVIFKKKKKK